MSTLLLTMFQFSKHFDAPLNFHDCFRPPSFIHSRSFSLTRKKTESGERKRERSSLETSTIQFFDIVCLLFLYENEAYGVIKNAMVTARVAV